MNLFLVIFIVISFNFQFIFNSPCQEVCHEENCSPPSNCLAGIVKVNCYFLFLFINNYF